MYSLNSKIWNKHQQYNIIQGRLHKLSARPIKLIINLTARQQKGVGLVVFVIYYNIRGETVENKR
jgi:hypothetical protein